MLNTLGDVPSSLRAVYSANITLAGLHEFWRNPETGDETPSAIIIITTANAFMSRLHDRMPVVLAERDFDAWPDFLAKPEMESCIIECFEHWKA